MAQVASSRKKTLLLLFTDLRAAFYSVINGILSRFAQTSESIEDMFEELGVPLAFVPLCDKIVQQPGLLDQLPDRHLLTSVVDTMKSTWFQVKGADQVVQPGGGTRPGMPLADYLFNIDFSPIQ
eukprot:763103-Pyramimonas_sp.AAC.1